MVLQSFIVFEGLDGSGTSTQIKLLQEKFASKNVWFTAEPTDKETGLFLRKMLKGEIKINPQTTAFMFATDRCEHLNGKDGVISHIEDGNLVISDRYLFSSLAYQNQECGKDLPYNLNKDFPLPEYLFFFDMNPEKSLERVFARANKTGEQTEIYEKLDFQKKTYQEYRKDKATALSFLKSKLPFIFSFTFFRFISTILRSTCSCHLFHLTFIHPHHLFHLCTHIFKLTS